MAYEKLFEYLYDKLNISVMEEQKKNIVHLINTEMNEKNNINSLVSNSLFDKGRMLVEANTYADLCIRRTIFGKNRELAKQRLITLYLLDEIDRLSKLK